MDRDDFLIRLYEEQVREMRHMDAQRTTISNAIFLLSVAVTGYVIKVESGSELFFLSIAVVVIGIYGLFSVTKLYERYHYYKERALKLANEIDATIEGSKVMPLLEEADEVHQQKHYILIGFKLFKLWWFLHAFIVLVGIVLCVKTY